MLIGTRVTGDVIEKKIMKIIDKSPTAKSLKKMLKQADKLFGDKALVTRATTFFEEATTLVSSKEAKNFFANVTELMKQLGEKTDNEVKLDLPTLPGAADDKE